MKGKIRRAICYIFLLVVSVFAVFPFFWMIVGSTNLSKDVSMGKLSFGSELMKNFNKLCELVDLKQVFFNSSKIAITLTIVSILICSMAGYGFEIYRTRTKDILFNILLLSMMLPFAAMMIPLFKIFSKMSMINSHIAVMLPTCATAFLIFFFRQSTKAFPKDLIEAAKIDGLGELMIFFKIFMPTMKSTYAAGAIIAFMASWNSFLWPLIIIQTPEKKTLPLVISSLASAYQPDYGVIMVAIVISVLPMLLIFFLLQKNFVEGMIGSIK